MATTTPVAGESPKGEPAPRSGGLGAGAVASPTAGEAPTVKLVVEAPCCNSVRTCRDTNKYVINVAEKSIIAEIPAVRCYRGVERIYEIEIEKGKLSGVVVVEHYVSNRGVHRLYFEYPKEVPAKVVEIVRELLGLTEVRKIVVR